MIVRTYLDVDIPMTFLVRRKNLGFKQSKVAKKLGLSTMGLSHLENSNRELKLSMLEKWAKVLNLEVLIEVKPK